MTLIAKFFVADVPVLISDALLSTDAPLRQTPLPIPSIRTSQQYHGSAPTTIAGLVQKMTLLGESAILCFAGDYALGREVSGYLKDRLAAGTHPELAWNNMRRRFALNSYSNVELIFEAMHPIGGDELELISESIGVRKAGDNYCSFDEVMFAGTGAAHAREVLARSDLGPVRDIEGKYERAVQRALHVVAELLDIDMRGGSSFAHHFGGFYEVAIWYGNRFKKIDGVQFVFWTIDIDENVTSLTLDRIFLQHYQDSVLCVDEVLVDDSIPIRLNLQTEQRLPIATLLHHRIPSLCRGYQTQEFELSRHTRFQQKLAVHCCRIQDATGRSTTATITSGKIQSPYDSGMVRVDDSSVRLAADTGRILKEHLVSAMQHCPDKLEHDRAQGSQARLGDRIRRFFRGR